MSLVTIAKNGRIYQRRFDHDLARQLHEEKGMSSRALAEHFGVSVRAVELLFNDKTRASNRAHSLEYAKRTRTPCIGGCGRLVWRVGKVGRDRSGLCLQCLGKQRAAPNMREDTLRCTDCREWKLDADFYSRTKNKSRRGRTTFCKRCQNKMRAEHRHRKPHLQHAQDRASYERRVRHKMAEWIVFVPNGDGFREFARVEATGATPAIEKVATEAGTYYAVSASRFVPMEVAPVNAFRVVKAAEVA